MGKKLLLQDLADALAERGGVSKRKAEMFSRAIFDVIIEGLTEDSFVKVKGFGTFKIVEVGERESVNVNTGQRFQINGHNRVAFTPDSVLKELVNRPFSQFQTVVINDGVDLAEMERVGDELLPLEQETETDVAVEGEQDGEKQGENDVKPADSQSVEVEDTPSSQDYEEKRRNVQEQPENIEDEEEETSSERAQQHEKETGIGSDSEEQSNDDSRNECKSEEVGNVPPPIPQPLTECPPPIPVVAAVVGSYAGKSDEHSDESKENPYKAENKSEDEAEIVPPQVKADCIDVNNQKAKRAFANETEVNGEENRHTTEQSSEKDDEEEVTSSQTQSSATYANEDCGEEGDSESIQKRRGFRLWRFTLIFLLLIILMLLSYFAGYFRILCPCSDPTAVTNKTQTLPATVPVDTAEKQNEHGRDTLNAAKDNADSANFESLNESRERRGERWQKTKETVRQSPDKAKDKYVITGTRQEYVVAKGETIFGIAEDVYGSKDYAVYIIRYNDLKNPNLVKVGTVIKLPELERADK